MDVATLYKQVALLGFEDSLENINSFYFAANRAIYQVNLLRPHIAEYRIFRHNMPNILRDGFCTYTRTEDMTFEAEKARAYYFEAAGKGTLFIEEYKDGHYQLIGEKTLESVDFAPYKGFIKAGNEFTDGKVRLRFAAHSSGDYIYFVRNVAIYGRLYGADIEDIPAYGEYQTYDMPELRPDFLELETPPIIPETGEKMSGGYGVDGGTRLILPYEAEGSFKVLYRRKPRELVNEGTPDEDITVIDLDEELCTLLPLLIASYVWAEDEPEKANYYGNLYRERAAEITNAKKTVAPSKFIHKSGW